MKANNLYLFTLKTLVNRQLYKYIYFDNLLKKYSHIENPISIYHYDTIERFENDYLIIEDTILDLQDIEQVKLKKAHLSFSNEDENNLNTL